MGNDPATLEALLLDCARQWPEYEWDIRAGMVVARHEGVVFASLGPVHGGWRAKAAGYDSSGRWVNESGVRRVAPLDAMEGALMHIRPDRPQQLPQEVPPIDPPGCWMALLVAMSIGFGALCVGWLTGGAQ